MHSSTSKSRLIFQTPYQVREIGTAMLKQQLFSIDRKCLETNWCFLALCIKTKANASKQRQISCLTMPRKAAACACLSLANEKIQIFAATALKMQKQIIALIIQEETIALRHCWLSRVKSKFNTTSLLSNARFAWHEVIAFFQFCSSELLV